MRKLTTINKNFKLAQADIKPMFFGGLIGQSPLFFFGKMSSTNFLQFQNQLYAPKNS